MTVKTALAVADRQSWASHDDFETRKAALEQLAAEVRRLEVVLLGLRDWLDDFPFAAWAASVLAKLDELGRS